MLVPEAVPGAEDQPTWRAPTDEPRVTVMVALRSVLATVCVVTAKFTAADCARAGEGTSTASSEASNTIMVVEI